MTEPVTALLQQDNTHLRKEILRLSNMLRRYMPDVHAWLDWVNAIRTEIPVRYISPTNDQNVVIGHGLMRSIHAIKSRWILANYTDRDLVLLVPEAGWDDPDLTFAIGEADRCATLCGIPTRAVAGLAWPVLGIELERGW